MRLYLVEVPGGEERPLMQRYCGTGADAKSQCLAYFEAFRESSIKKSDIMITQVDVPTDKAGLLDYLNGIVS